MDEVRHLLAAASQRLGDRLEAELLIAHALQRTRSWLIAHATDRLDAGQLAACEALLARRAEGEPVAYILGRRGFWSLDLEVGPATLIPRPETELLIELALQRLPASDALALVDLGTGSGAIALALACERPRWRITATDVSAAALQVAQRNAQRLQLGQVAFVQGDWLAPLAGRQFAAILSNPPYIEAGDPHLAQGDLRFEPAGALASGADGLDDIRRIVAAAREHLQPGGLLMFEHGWQQGGPIRHLLEAAGYAAVFTATDLEQRDRVSGGYWP